MPLEIQSHTIPHLKALISGKMEPRGLRWGSTFRVCQTLFKSAYLLHKEAYRANLFVSHCTYVCRYLVACLLRSFLRQKVEHWARLVISGPQCWKNIALHPFCMTTLVV